MRVVKEPEVRKREMIDTAMRVFARNGFEASSMADIAREMQVVPGLCYRYFRSKQDLYDQALAIYAKECAAPYIAVFNRADEGLESLLQSLSAVYLKADKEIYCEFFHDEGNEIFHQQLTLLMMRELLPTAEKALRVLLERGEIRITDPSVTASFILYGQVALLADESGGRERKAAVILDIIRAILGV